MVLDIHEIDVLTQRFLPEFHYAITSAKFNTREMLENVSSGRLLFELERMNATNILQNTMHPTISDETVKILREFDLYDTYMECKADFDLVAEEIYGQAKEGTLDEANSDRILRELDRIKNKLRAKMNIQLAKRLGKNMIKVLGVFVPLLVAVGAFTNFYLDRLENSIPVPKKERHIVPKWDGS